MPSKGSSADSNVDPWAVQLKISAQDARYALASSLMPTAGLSYIDYRSGVFASGGGNTTHNACRVAAGSGLQVTVQPGNVVINTQNSGPYTGVIDSVKTLSLAAASSTQNRIDAVVARIYDDLNGNLGGQTSGVRKLAVEVWTGDGSTGTPGRPNLDSAIGAGWIPLAYVTVPANATSLTAASIEDARGPGIVARGGMRGLYGADSVPGSDAFNAAGAYPGDQRWVHNSGFQHQVYYGSNVGWRGVHNAMTFNANPTYTGGLNWSNDGNHRQICSVTIPDPGTPYMIYPSARVEATIAGAGTSAFYIQAGTDNVNWTNAVNYGPTGSGGDREHTVPIAPIMWGPITGPSTVRLTGRRLEGSGGWAINGAKNGATLLSVVVYPSTVQPGS